MTPHRGADRGFTLLEVLVALVVLGFVVAGLAQGTRFGLRALDRQSAQVNAGGDMDAVDRVLRRLVEQMDPGTGRDPPVVQGGERGLAFVTDLGVAAAALGTRDAAVRLALEQGRLVLLWTPHRHATLFAAPPPPERVVLLERLSGLELAYWGPPDGEGVPVWQPRWEQRALPGLVRIRLIFPAGSGRRWPDIIAGPRRERIGS